MEVTLTVAIKVTVPDGTEVNRLFVDIPHENITVQSTEGYEVEAEINGFETVAADKDED